MLYLQVESFGSHAMVQGKSRWRRGRVRPSVEDYNDVLWRTTYVVVYLVTQRVDPWLVEAGMFPQFASNGTIWDYAEEDSQWSCVIP